MEMPDMQGMAPPDAEWHQMYADGMVTIGKVLWDLQTHPSAAKAEDLGDWVEALMTLVTFFPHTHKYFEDKARQ
jgi:hypothetical protein